ncbi:unnamed protein product, partial [Prorocentrum cordatum]
SLLAPLLLFVRPNSWFLVSPRIGPAAMAHSVARTCLLLAASASALSLQGRQGAASTTAAQPTIEPLYRPRPLQPPAVRRRPGPLQPDRRLPRRRHGGADDQPRDVEGPLGDPVAHARAQDDDAGLRHGHREVRLVLPGGQDLARGGRPIAGQRRVRQEDVGAVRARRGQSFPPPSPRTPASANCCSWILLRCHPPPCPDAAIPAPCRPRAPGGDGRRSARARPRHVRRLVP